MRLAYSHCAALSEYQLTGHKHFRRSLGLTTVDDAVEQADRHRADLAFRDVYRGQSRGQKAAHRQVVKAHDRNVLWDAMPQFLQGTHQAVGHNVIHAEIGVGDTVLRGKVTLGLGIGSVAPR